MPYNGQARSLVPFLHHGLIEPGIAGLLFAAPPYAHTPAA
jgi:hypothetical protein